MLRYKQKSKFPCAPASNPESSLRTKFFWIKQHLSPSGIQLIELNHLQQASERQRGIKTLMSIIWNRAGRLFRVLLSFSVTLCSKCLQDFVVAFLGRYRQGGRSHRWPSRSAGSTCFLRSAAGRWCHSAQSRYCCCRHWQHFRVWAVCLMAAGRSTGRSASDDADAAVLPERWWWWWRWQHQMRRQQTGLLQIQRLLQTLRSCLRTHHSAWGLGNETEWGVYDQI